MESIAEVECDEVGINAIFKRRQREVGRQFVCKCEGYGHEVRSRVGISDGRIEDRERIARILVDHIRIRGRREQRQKAGEAKPFGQQ